MEDDFVSLVGINREITAAENAGDASTLDRRLAPTFAFRRADGTIVNREQFLQAVKQSGPRTLSVESIALLGRHRAIVTCVVSMPVNGQPKAFDNVRLFVRSAGGDWQLMGWANEPV
jgi:hypothetical protein